MEEHNFPIDPERSRKGVLLLGEEPTSTDISRASIKVHIPSVLHRHRHRPPTARCVSPPSQRGHFSVSSREHDSQPDVSRCAMFRVISSTGLSWEEQKQLHPHSGLQVEEGPQLTAGGAPDSCCPASSHHVFSGVLGRISTLHCPAAHRDLESVSQRRISYLAGQPARFKVV